MLQRRRKLRALNGLQPLKEAFSSFCCIFPQPVQPRRNVAINLEASSCPPHL